MSHDHDHGHDHEHHEHDHNDDLEPALQTLLYHQIEFQKVTTMNESVPDSGMKVLEKTWNQRLETSPSLTSDADEQLLMMIP